MFGRNVSMAVSCLSMVFCHAPQSALPSEHNKTCDAIFGDWQPSKQIGDERLPLRDCIPRPEIGDELLKIGRYRNSYAILRDFKISTEIIRFQHCTTNGQIYNLSGPLPNAKFTKSVEFSYNKTKGKERICVVFGDKRKLCFVRLRPENAECAAQFDMFDGEPENPPESQPPFRTGEGKN